MIEREKKSLILRREHKWVGAHVTPYWMTSARDGLAPATLTLLISSKPDHHHPRTHVEQKQIHHVSSCKLVQGAWIQLLKDFIDGKTNSGYLIHPEHQHERKT